MSLTFTDHSDVAAMEKAVSVLLAAGLLEEKGQTFDSSEWLAYRYGFPCKNVSEAIKKCELTLTLLELIEIHMNHISHHSASIHIMAGDVGYTNSEQHRILRKVAETSCPVADYQESWH